MKMVRVSWLAAMVIVAVAGCSVIETGTAKRIEGVEGKKLSDGTWYLYDTPSHWAEFQRMMDIHIEKEQSGKHPYRDNETSWNDFWKARILSLSSDRQENSSKYINYIVEARRRAGLPELEGYPPQP